MPDPSALTEVLVSVQSARPDPRHLAAGLIGDDDLVLVPAPPPGLLDHDELDVVTIPVPLDGGYPVERLRARCVHVLWLRDGRDRPVGAMLKLHLSTGYRPTIASFNGGRLADELDRNRGDLWAALENLGMVRPGLREGPPPDLLAALPDVERRQRRFERRDHDHPEPGSIGWSLCKWLCICQSS
jgi:hypothetical protein